MLQNQYKRAGYYQLIGQTPLEPPAGRFFDIIKTKMLFEDTFLGQLRKAGLRTNFFVKF